MPNKLAIVGITRFSVVTRSSLTHFSLTGGRDRPDAEKQIFTADRLRVRFRLFRTLTLPSMAMVARRYQHFRYLVLTSRNLPLLWRLRLKTMVWRYPWCQIVELLPDENIRRRARAEASAFAKRAPLFSFRIDDDDALSVTYLDALLAHVNVKAAAAYCFDRGLYVQNSKQGTLMAVPTHKPLVAVGLGYLDPSGKKTVFDLGNHTKIAEQGPVSTLPGAPFWIKSIHAGNDSKDPFAGYLDGCLGPADLDRAMREYFPHIDIGRLTRALGPGSRGDIRGRIRPPR